MVAELNNLVNVIYAIHADLLSVSVCGKDCEKFATALSRIAMVQNKLTELAEEAKEEKEDVGNS